MHFGKMNPKQNNNSTSSLENIIPQSFALGHSYQAYNSSCGANAIANQQELGRLHNYNLLLHQSKYLALWISIVP